MKKMLETLMAVIMNDELRKEKQNVVDLMVDRDKIKEELNKYSSLWEELKKQMQEQINFGVLEKMNELEMIYGTSNNL